MQVNEGLAPFSFQWLFSKFALRIILASNQEFIIKVDHKSGKIAPCSYKNTDLLLPTHFCWGYCTSLSLTLQSSLEMHII